MTITLYTILACWVFWRGYIHALVAVLVKAVQEQQAQIEELRALLWK